MNRDLLLAITIPDDLHVSDDPDDVADEVVRILNSHRRTSAWAKAILAGDGSNSETAWNSVERVMVNAIPSPQWLSRETLDALRKAAQG